ncbi:hypothetical protein F4803DRAFT_535873 [Xylaria telfairii]|nr:hypothetical protein F4803DRAFT_535873 [Xylaria telfairii]
MPFVQKIAAVMCLALVGMAKPTHSSDSFSKRAQPDDTDPNILVQPTMYQVLPLDSSTSGPPVSQLEVQRTGDTSTIENIVIFDGIAENATTCTLGWIQAARDERNFTVIGNGLLAAQQLSKLPDGEVSWENIVPVAKESVEQGWPLLHPDTTDWAEIDTPASHVAGLVDCYGTIYLKLQIAESDGDGYVYLGQDALNGLTLEFH